ncbi:MAG TPA: hypothetical protein VGM90_41390 [Kofleriaceae bacterium]|jgi:hypothetical protein
MRNIVAVTTQLRAESAWTSAEAADTLDAWAAAADLFEQARDECTSDCSELAYAAVVARGKEIQHDPSLEQPEEKPTEPQSIPERVQTFIADADSFVESSPDAEAAPSVAFLAAVRFDNYGWVDESIARYDSLIQKNPAHEVSEFSANLLLDALDRAGRYDELVRFANLLAGNVPLMTAYPDLAETVQNILAHAPH